MVWEVLWFQSSPAFDSARLLNDSPRFLGMQTLNLSGNADAHKMFGLNVDHLSVFFVPYFMADGHLAQMLVRDNKLLFLIYRPWWIPGHRVFNGCDNLWPWAFSCPGPIIHQPCVLIHVGYMYDCKMVITHVRSVYYVYDRRTICKSTMYDLVRDCETEYAVRSCLTTRSSKSSG